MEAQILVFKSLKFLVQPPKPSPDRVLPFLQQRLWCLHSWSGLFGMFMPAGDEQQFVNYHFNHHDVLVEMLIALQFLQIYKE